MPYEIPLHEHGFWHLDLVRTGKITAFGEDWTRELPPGEAILLPAGCRHGFRYGPGEKTWLSLKFEVTGDLSLRREPVWLDPKDPTALAFVRLLDHLDQGSAVGPDPMAPVFERVLDGLMELLFGDLSSPGESEPMAFRHRVDLIIAEAQGRPIRLPDLAQRMGLSVSRLSEKFSEEASCPLKRYLDRKRADYAQRALVYADANVSLVADQMGFPDPFTFSRFFKRVTCENPRDYRKRMR